MNRFIPSGESIVLFRMSAGAEHHTAQSGKFQVRYKRRHSRHFPTLLEAFLFYYTVEEEAELWDNNAQPFLVEQKIKLHLN